MRLTNYSDFALRSLIYLAVKPKPDEFVNIVNIANSYRISKSHLTKIIHQLGRLGYVETVRGKNGGIRLAMHPTKINIGQLIRHTENDFALVQCFEQLQQTQHNSAIIPTMNFSTKSTEYCAIAPACMLKPALAEAAQAFISVLDKYTLADFLLNKDDLLELFN